MWSEAQVAAPGAWFGRVATLCLYCWNMLADTLSQAGIMGTYLPFPRGNFFFPGVLVDLLKPSLEPLSAE